MEFGFLFVDWFGKPAWMWLAFIGIVALLGVLSYVFVVGDVRRVEYLS